MRIGSLFSGIGGLELGLEAGLGPSARTVWQVEIDEYCRRVLAKHWPDVERHDDVTTFNKLERDVDLICGGFPCQDVSSAGKGAGLKGARSGLWFEFARIVGTLEPKWVVVENVASGLRRWLPTVRNDLHRLGYRTRAFMLSAFDVGAPHLRKRVFVLAADAERVTLRDLEQWQPRRRQRGLREEGQAVALDNGAERTLTDVDDKRHQGWQWSRDGNKWTFESPVPGALDGVSNRLDAARRKVREKQLGNAVVPQCAECIGRLIRSYVAP